MKSLLPFFFLLNFFIGNTTTYFSQGSLDPGLLSSWGTLTVGGTAPGSFTNPGDVFIIQTGHFMTTTATWTIGGSGSILEIKNGGTLQGDHTIVLTGTFQIDNGGTYIHNNTGPVAQIAGSSIFSGAESFAISSNFEIRKWENNIVGLPNTAPGILWGNLIINLQIDLGGAWNWNFPDPQTLTINGNLDIRSTYISTPAELRITPTGTHTVNVGGNFLLSGITTQVAIKKRLIVPLDGYTTMQVNGNISLTGSAQLDLGINTTSTTAVGLYELRFKGNFSAAAGTFITSSSSTPYLVANGISPQTLSSASTMDCNFRVAPGATLNLSSTFTVGANRVFAISGTFNQNTNTMTVNGTLETAAGAFNSNGPFTVGINCMACTGNGTYNTTDNTWCALAGAKGVINFTGNSVSLDNTISNTLISAGSFFINSPGDIYFVNSIAASLSAGPLPAGYFVKPGSIFSLDANSYLSGSNATYAGEGGTLRIGSVDGITATGNTTNGNIRVGQLKAYNNSGTNNFEYFGTSPQVSGIGLPATINGTLKINNTAGIGTLGVTLSQNTTVSGVLDLSDGKLTTSASQLLNIDDNATVINYSNNSFVYGPMRKTGDETFVFPIGEGAELHTAELIQVSGDSPADIFQVEYRKANPQIPYPFTPAGGIDHISALEYWQIDNISGAPGVTKQVTLLATTYSDATDLTKLRILNYTAGSWQNDGNAASGPGASGPVTSNSVDTYGPFTFGSIDGFNGNPLPINLVSFEASKLTNTQASINWELAACCSSTARFEIQRAGADKSFVTAGSIGGSPTNRFYNYTDNGLKNGINYYRLKMIDEDGKITYSRIEAIINGVNDLLLTSLIPTVITATASLTIASSNQQKIDLIIVDMQGRMMMKQNYTVAAGNTNIQLSTAGLAAGVYQLAGVTSEGKTNSIRFIKQ